jgi:hypothetical protein
MLLSLAAHGPMRLQDAVSASWAGFPTNDGLANLDATGLIVRYGTDRVRMIALNPAFPALEQFVRLLRGIYTSVSDRPSPPSLPVSGAPPPMGIVNGDSTDLFGFRFQTICIFATCRAGGTLDLATLERLVKSQGGIIGHFRRAIKATEERLILQSAGKSVIVHPDFPHPDALVDFVNAFVLAQPEYNFAVPPKQRKRRNVSQRLRKMRGRRYDWKEGPRKSSVPLGLQGSTDGTPLLFGSVTRFRVIIALATTSAIPSVYLRRDGRIGIGTYMRVKSEGLIDVAEVVIGRHRSFCRLNPALPAYPELVRLAQALATNWPVPIRVPPDPVPLDIFSPAESRVSIQQYFGSSARSETLLTLSALGQGNVAAIRRSVKLHDRHEVSRALEMFTHFDILRLSPNAITKKTYELNPDWFAATELRDLLEALRKIDGRYDARAFSRDEPGKRTRRRA